MKTTTVEHEESHEIMSLDSALDRQSDQIWKNESLSTGLSRFESDRESTSVNNGAILSCYVRTHT
jgi:hypothetical protein